MVSTVYRVPMTDSRQLTSMRGSSAIWRAASARWPRSCKLPVSLSGLPGVTSHHTRSSFKRLIANRLMSRCATCGGLNEPPGRPMRMPLLWGGMAWETDGEATQALFNWTTAGADQSLRFGAGSRLKTLWRSRPRLPCAVDAIFEAGQLLGADRAAGVKFSGGDADFRAEAEFAAVGELGRCVMQHDRRIDLVEKLAGGGFIFGHDRVGVARTMVVNMRDRLVDAVDDFRGDDRVLVFGAPVFVGGRLHPAIGALHGGVAAHLAARLDQHLDQRLEKGRRAGAIDQQ